jgi:hypothetical protein
MANIKTLETRFVPGESRENDISHLVLQFGEDKKDYITQLYDSYINLITPKARINPEFIEFFAYKETKGDLINQFGDNNKSRK